MDGVETKHDVPNTFHTRVNVVVATREQDEDEAGLLLRIQLPLECVCDQFQRSSAIGISILERCRQLYLEYRRRGIRDCHPTVPTLLSEGLQEASELGVVRTAEFVRSPLLDE